MNKVVVVGGGFAGVSALLTLIKRIRASETILTLIDRQNFHLFTPSLYEVATSEEPQKNIAIPFSEIFGSKVNLVNGNVNLIDTKERKIILEDGRKIDFDYLLISIGSESNFFGVEGLKENSLDLKTLENAMQIKDSIRRSFEEKQKGQKTVRIVVGGGGFSGTELVSELLSYQERLRKETGEKTGGLELSVMEGSERLLSTLEPKVSQVAQARLERNGVKLYLNSTIQEVKANKILTRSGQAIDFDLLLWTGGVGISEILAKSGFSTNKRGQVEVNEFLQVKGEERIFAAGDDAAYTDAKDQKLAPGVAQVAQEEGRVAGENIAALISKKPLILYQLRHFGYLIPLKGRFVIADLGWLYLSGLLGWFLQQLVFLRYLLETMPISKALRRWDKFELELKQN